MATRSESVELPVEDQRLAGTFLSPDTRMPGLLFVHGWGGSQERDLKRARGIAGLGCVCLTFDMRGHGGTLAQQQGVTREDNLHDLIAAYDLLARHPAIDRDAIAVVGSSYGGYLATILTSLRPVKWLALRVPALYRDAEWSRPKRELDRQDLQLYRNSPLTPADNRALGACAAFRGDVLLVESENDQLIPHTTLMNYRSAFVRAHSLTHRIIDGADHALSGELCQQAYTSILVHWVTEMVVKSRVGSLSPEGRRG
ncbi:alpha/beta hydrolase family protein [Azotobacter chroococcum]|jgi:pimeloyl-ACP methyl ester carboxylesterase|uniref:Alpha/beta hydrolase n=1 Tax=Azotobacter chroococcum TaxID=353 RepID=A0AAQ0BZD0_9GAMM|nr:alpha/beta fold hydrolase [Azotobacter chroococcum]QQE88889.1 alpha/beta hydrolase [Azotobacter chroococcum]TBW10369.1 alpha/beta fold hydrolase [Azotobacter chroococcum]